MHGSKKATYAFIKCLSINITKFAVVISIIPGEKRGIEIDPRGQSRSSFALSLSYSVYMSLLGFFVLLPVAFARPGHPL